MISWSKTLLASFPSPEKLLGNLTHVPGATEGSQPSGRAGFAREAISKEEDGSRVLANAIKWVFGNPCLGAAAFEILEVVSLCGECFQASDAEAD